MVTLSSRDLKTRTAGPEHGPWGILINQARNKVYDRPGEHSLDEINEVYMKETSWKGKETIANYTDSDIKHTTKAAHETSVTSNQEWGAHGNLLAMLDGIGFRVGGEYRYLLNHNETTGESAKEKFIIKPGQKLHHYREEHKLTMRTWWIVDTWGAERVVTDLNDGTLSGHVELIVSKGLAHSSTELDGKGNLLVVPIKKQWDDSPGSGLPRYRYTNMNDDLQEQVDFYQKKSKGMVSADARPPPPPLLSAPAEREISDYFARIHSLLSF